MYIISTPRVIPLLKILLKYDYSKFFWKLIHVRTSQIGVLFVILQDATLVRHDTAVRQMAANLLCVLFCYYWLLLAGGVVSGFTPVTYPARVSSECGQYDPLQDEQLTEALKQAYQQFSIGRSCQEILQRFPSTPSGYYEIITSNGSLVQVYCDMEGSNCGGEGGWTRVAYVNMSRSGATCPQGLTQRTLSGLTLCGRMDGDFNVTTAADGGCQSTVFSTLGLSYSQVCGQVRGYQYFAPWAFYSSMSVNINNAYVDGASITYGKAPRKHIWTYANGRNLRTGSFRCPCNTGSDLNPPHFVGSDYYCETGDNDDTCCDSILYSNDVLWDGQQCPGIEAPCCSHPNMPWFKKTLNETTTEDIELRVCGYQRTTSEDTPLEVIELFVL